LALANSQDHPVPLLDELAQPFAIPKASCDTHRFRILSQNRIDFLQLFVAQSPRTTGSFSFYKAT
jgi:hypothetical protein